MEEIKDGGPAFPGEDRTVVFETGHEHCARKIFSGINKGMTLRDWFAGMAMQGQLASQSESEGHYSDWSKLAVVCFEISDAMLKHRGQK